MIQPALSYIQFLIAKIIIRCLPTVRQSIEDATHHCDEINSCADHLAGGGSFEQPFGETYTPQEARDDLLIEAGNAAVILRRLF